MGAPALSTEGQRIAVVNLAPNSTTVHIFDIASGDESIEPIPWPNEAAPPRAIAFTADDRTLLIGDQDGGITEIDVATRTVSPSRFEGMHGPAVRLYSLPDGDLLAISRDGTMSIYDSTSGEPLGPPMGWAPAVKPDLFSVPNADLGLFSLPNADLRLHHVLAPDRQGLRLWNIDPSTWPTVACQRAGRNLTRDEWTRYLPADEPYRSTCLQFPAG